MGLFGFGKKKRQSEEAAEAAAKREKDSMTMRMIQATRRWNSGNHPSGTVR